MVDVAMPGELEMSIDAKGNFIISLRKIVSVGGWVVFTPNEVWLELYSLLVFAPFVLSPFINVGF